MEITMKQALYITVSVLLLGIAAFIYYVFQQFVIMWSIAGMLNSTGFGSAGLAAEVASLIYNTVYIIAISAFLRLWAAIVAGINETQ